MTSSTITKMKATIRPTNTSCNSLRLENLARAAFIESNNSANPWSEQNFISCLENTNNLSIALNHKDQLIGYLIAVVATSSAELLNIGIDSRYQRKGHATMLLAHLFGELIDKGVSEVFLEVRISNKIAIAFYKSQGFKQISLRKNYYTKNFKNNSTREDAIIMSLKIDSKEKENVL